MKKLFHLSFVPRSVDFGLLVLRLWFGLTLLLNHGWGKLAHFSQMAAMLPDPLHVGGTVNMVLILFSEVLCALGVAIGFAVRFAAAVIFIELLIAFMAVHHASLAMGPHSGELPWCYMGAALAIVFAGGGRFVVCKVSNVVDAPAPAPAA